MSTGKFRRRKYKVYNVSMSEKSLQKNYNYCQETISLKTKIEEGFLVLGERLAKIRDELLYTKSWETFEDFLEEMGMSPSAASKLINIYLKFVVSMNIPREKLLSMGGWSDLSDLLPYVNTKKEAIEMIENMSGLMRVDRRKLLQEKKTGIQMSECKHDWIDVHFRQCSICGDREKVYNN